MKLFQSIKRKYIRWDRSFALSKRQQFVIVTLLLAVGLMLTQLVSNELRYPMTVGLSILTYLLSAFALREDLHKVEWITLLTLPTMFTAAVALFYFLLPARWLTRIPFVALYAVGMYALLLTENIYNVAVDRTIALLRAAHSVGFLLTLVTYFLLVQTIMAFRYSFYVNALLIFGVSYLLALQSLWSSQLDTHINQRVGRISLVSAIILAELTWTLSFMPAPSSMKVLFLTTSFYGIVGMGQQYLVEKLYKKTVLEFFILCSIVFIFVLLSTNWRGNL